MNFFNEDIIKAKFNKISNKSHFYHSTQISGKNSPNQYSSVSSSFLEKEKDNIKDKYRSFRSQITSQTSEVNLYPLKLTSNAISQSLFQSQFQSHSQSQPDLLYKSKKFYINLKDQFRPKEVNKFISSKNQAFENLQLLALMDDPPPNYDTEREEEDKGRNYKNGQKSDIIIPKLDFRQILQKYNNDNVKISIPKRKSKFFLNSQSSYSSLSLISGEEIKENEKIEENEKKKEKHHHHNYNNTDKKHKRRINNALKTNYESQGKIKSNLVPNIDVTNMKQIFSDIYGL